MSDYLVVVDYQTDFVCGALGFPQARALEQPLCRAVEQQLRRGGRVLFTLDTHGEQYLQTREGRHLPVRHCARGSEGHSLYGALKSFAPRVQLLEKDSFGARSLVTDCPIPDGASITVCGVVTHLCVLTNAILLQTACPCSEITVDAALCADPNAALEQAAFDLMEHLHLNVINRRAMGHTVIGRDVE